MEDEDKIINLKQKITIFIFLVHFLPVSVIGGLTATTGRNIVIPENQEKTEEKKKELGVLTLFTGAFIFLIYADLFFRFGNNVPNYGSYNEPYGCAHNGHCSLIESFFKLIGLKNFSSGLTTIVYLVTIILTGIVLGFSLNNDNLVTNQPPTNPPDQ